MATDEHSLRLFDDGHWVERERGRVLVCRTHPSLQILWDSEACDLAREFEEMQATIKQLKAIVDRPLADDLNVLLNRCEAQEPLSAADQRELYEWMQERDGTIVQLQAANDGQKEAICNQMRTIQALQTEVERLQKRLSKLEEQLWPPDVKLTYAEIRERLLEMEKRHTENCRGGR